MEIQSTVERAEKPNVLALEIEELEERERVSGHVSHTTARTCCTCIPLTEAPPAES